ncbi:MAG TPA: cation:proton antiporter [Bellilinea sp.]|jgi:Kef-type K+ transport system membrane component KefB|nr:cation:proton antiporter [Bellilinea sp.]
MTAFLQLVFLLAIILLAAKAGGLITTKLGQPSVLGELIVGLLLGPTLLDIVHLPFISDVHIGESVHYLGELGVLILMFLAGLELHLDELKQNTKVSALGGVLGVIVPVALGALAGEIFGLTHQNAIFLGLTLGATSVSISAQTLMELKVLRSRVGLGLLGAAVFDDILVILLLSTFVAVADGGSAVEIILVFVKMIAFLGLSILIGLKALPWLARKISRLPISQGLLTFAIFVMLFYGFSAEVLGGMAAITGTFIAGLMFSRTPEKAQIETGLRAMAYSFFVPIFFVNIGLSVDLTQLHSSAIVMMLVITVFAVIGKIIGAGLGAKAGGFSWLESLQLGIGMVSRGEVGLIVATIGLQSGHLSSEVFSTIVGMVLFSTLLTPPMLRAAFNQPSQKSNPPLDQHA